MRIQIPEISLVVLAGPSGSGKSSFAVKHFLRTEIVSSDWCRGLVSDNENDWSINQDAFDIVFCITRKRVKNQKLVVVDATNLGPRARAPLVRIAQKARVPIVAVILDIDPEICWQRNKLRNDRGGREVVDRHSQVLREFIDNLSDEGISASWVLRSPQEVDDVVIERIQNLEKPLKIQSLLDDDQEPC